MYHEQKYVERPYHEHTYPEHPYHEHTYPEHTYPTQSVYTCTRTHTRTPTLPALKTAEKIS